MNGGRATRIQLAAAAALLLVLQFYLRPRVYDGRLSPDFLLFGLVLFAMRTGPGPGAVAGFLVGLATDALNPARFGASALAHTVVGYAAAWARAVFFADNVLVNAGFVAIGLWLRDLVLLVASGTPERQLVLELALLSPLQALITGGLGAVVLVLFRQWFAIRLDT